MMSNKSGVEPIEYNVIILPDAVKEKTAGGIILTDETKEQEQSGSTRGTVVAVADLAFSYEPELMSNKPAAPGDRVLYARYAGATFEGDDGQTYRIVKDKDITGKVK